MVIEKMEASWGEIDFFFYKRNKREGGGKNRDNFKRIDLRRRWWYG